MPKPFRVILLSQGAQNPITLYRKSEQDGVKNSRQIKGSSKNSFWRTNESFCPRLRQAKAALSSNKARFAFLAGEQKSSICRSKAILRATHIKE
jgi:hypothetical protein